MPIGNIKKSKNLKFNVNILLNTFKHSLEKNLIKRANTNSFTKVINLMSKKASLHTRCTSNPIVF